MNYRVETCTDTHIWNEFVLASPQNNLFCRTDFLDSSQQNYDLLFVVKDELILMGVVIVKDGDGKPVTNPFMYQGVLFSDYMEILSSHKRIKKSLDLIHFLLTELESIYGSISLSLHTKFTDVRGFQWHNYHNQKGHQPALDLKYTGILDLREVENIDQILTNVRTVRRQEYRSCKRNEFTIEESTDLDILNDLHAKTFERQGMERTKSQVFMATTLAKESLSRGFGRLVVCRDKSGTPASASLFLFDNETGYYLLGANAPDYRKYGTGSYVVFEQIRYCIEKGLFSIDFLGINSPLRSDFKTSFNAKPYPYFLFCMK